MTRLSVVASLLLVASVGAVELIARSADELGSLFTRQSTILDPADIPSACQSQCTGIVSALNSCTTTTCICTNTNARGLEACVNCLVSLANTPAMQTQGQSILDNFVAGCGGAVSPLTIAGGSTASASAPTVSSASSVSSGSVTTTPLTFAPTSSSSLTSPLTSTTRTSTAPQQTISDIGSGSSSDDPFSSGAMALGQGAGFISAVLACVAAGAVFLVV
ncbi:Extracellular membrane protein CFEM domain-containing protein [Pleurotus pulmonarius]